jgi:hypothetical protein
VIVRYVALTAALVLSAVAFGVAFSGRGPVSAMSAAQQGNAVAGAAALPTTQGVAAVNKFCPIHRDNPVDPLVPCVIYQGKAIGFCCPDCIDEFNKDPAKYVANMR